MGIKKDRIKAAEEIDHFHITTKGGVSQMPHDSDFKSAYEYTTIHAAQNYDGFNQDKLLTLATAHIQLFQEGYGLIHLGHAAALIDLAIRLERERFVS
jgi:hypothetical protein